MTEWHCDILIEVLEKLLPVSEEKRANIIKAVMDFYGVALPKD